MNRHLGLITEYVLSSSKAKPVHYKLPLSVEMAVILATQQEPKGGEAFSALCRALGVQLNSPVLSQFSAAFILFLRFFFNNLAWRSSFFSQLCLSTERGLVFLNLGVLEGEGLSNRLRKLTRFSRSFASGLNGLVVIPLGSLDTSGDLSLAQCHVFPFQSKSCGSLASFVQAMQPCLVGICAAGAATGATTTPNERSPLALPKRSRPSSTASASDRRLSHDKLAPALARMLRKSPAPLSVGRLTNQPSSALKPAEKTPKLLLPSGKEPPPPNKYYPILFVEVAKDPIKSLRKLDPIRTRITRRSLMHIRDPSVSTPKETLFRIPKPSFHLLKTLSRNTISDSARTVRVTRRSELESPTHRLPYPAFHIPKPAETKLIRRRDNLRSVTSEGNPLSLSFDVTKIKS